MKLETGKILNIISKGFKKFCSVSKLLSYISIVNFFTDSILKKKIRANAIIFKAMIRFLNEKKLSLKFFYFLNLD